MPSARDDAKTLAEAARIRDDDKRRKAARDLSKQEKESVSVMEGGATSLMQPKLRNQWRDELTEGTTDLQWDEWLAQRNKKT